MIQLLLPTVIAGSERLDDATTALRETARELTAAFDGLTAYLRAPALGVWTSPAGRTERDDVVMVEVVTSHFDKPWWRHYAATLAERFRQETIHVRALPIDLLDGGD